MSTGIHLVHATANPPGGGAIAILQLHGDSRDILHQLTGVNNWPIGRMRLVNFANIDEGLAVRLNDSVTQLMPHGGPRVVQRLTAKLIELGAVIATDLDRSSISAREIFPEAADEIEALMLQTLARAQSPLAIDLLLDQPRRWREFKSRGETLTQADHERSTRLNRLITPPLVVLAGRPNVGKSTLSNALLGRSMSIALDMPGTTRDYIAARIELAGLVVDWHDTPGLRQSNDVIEQRAIELAHSLMQRADLLIAMTDPETDWPDLPRPPHLRVMNKVDLNRTAELTSRCAIDSSDLSARIVRISANTGENLAAFVAASRDVLIQAADHIHPGPWLFDERLLRE